MTARMQSTTAQSDSEAVDHRGADRLLLETGRHGMPWLALLAATAVGIALAETALPAVLAKAVDELVTQGDAGVWLAWLAGLVAVLVAVDALDDLAVGATVARSTAWVRHEVVGHVLAVGVRATRLFRPGDIATRLVGNTAQAGRLAPDIVRACANLIPGLGGTIALAVIDPWLCVTFLAGMPVIALIVRAFARDASRVVRRYLEVQAGIAARLTDALGGARTIAAAGTAEREAERILAPLPELHQHGLDNWRTQMRLSAQNGVVVSLLELAVLAVAGVQLANGRITPGELLAASQYVLLAMMLGSSVSSLAGLARSRASAGRIAEVLATGPVRFGRGHLPPGRGRLELRGVTARGSDGERILGPIDLEIPGASLVALVGRSGAGKSLLAALLGRLADPDEGDVILDGLPLRELSHEELRRNVGYAFERPLLFGETIADAIAFGAFDPPQEAIAAGARAARADDFIKHMPGGYGTPLADAPMSGGEVQRVGLARTFAHAGRVMVLDDVAASLDTVTEHDIGRVLTGEFAGRTRIVVAHRASTAARTDLVVWLEDGMVRAVAPHHALWRDRDYRALFEATGDRAWTGTNGNGTAGANGKGAA